MFLFFLLELISLRNPWATRVQDRSQVGIAFGGYATQPLASTLLVPRIVPSPGSDMFARCPRRILSTVLPSWFMMLLYVDTKGIKQRNNLIP
jgi:hypothetical protein